MKIRTYIAGIALGLAGLVGTAQAQSVQAQSSAQAQSYQGVVNNVLTDEGDKYNLSVAQGPTKLIDNDTAYDIAGAAQAKDSTAIAVVNWKGQKKPEQAGPYTFLTYDTTQMSQAQFKTQLTSDLEKVLGVTGIEDIVKKQMKLYPNPTHGKVTIALDKEGGNYTVDVYNILGQRVQRRKGNFNGSKIHLNIGAYARGEYVVRVGVDKNKKVYTEKVIKQ